MAPGERTTQEFADYLVCRLLRAAKMVRGRMRMQKTLFLLGAQESPVFDDFFFHLRGPYSPALARTLSYLADQRLVAEKATRVSPDRLRYCYSLTPIGNQVLRQFESHASVAGAVKKGERYETRFLELVKLDVRQLELAATVVYWQKMGYERKDAMRITAQLKDARPQSAAFRGAMRIVRDVLGPDHN